MTMEKLVLLSLLSYLFIFYNHKCLASPLSSKVTQDLTYRPEEGERGKYLYKAWDFRILHCFYCPEEAFLSNAQNDKYLVDECSEKNYGKLDEYEKKNHKYPYCNSGEEITCPPLPNILNGRWIIPYNFTQDKVRVYYNVLPHCDPGYELVHNSSVEYRCNEKLQWSTNVSTPFCMELPKSANISVPTKMELPKPFTKTRDETTTESTLLGSSFSTESVYPVSEDPSNSHDISYIVIVGVAVGVLIILVLVIIGVVYKCRKSCCSGKDKTGSTDQLRYEEESVELNERSSSSSATSGEEQDNEHKERNSMEKEPLLEEVTISRSGNDCFEETDQYPLPDNERSNRPERENNELDTLDILDEQARSGPISGLSQEPSCLADSKKPTPEMATTEKLAPEKQVPEKPLAEKPKPPDVNALKTEDQETTLDLLSRQLGSGAISGLTLKSGYGNAEEAAAELLERPDVPGKSASLEPKIGQNNSNSKGDGTGLEMNINIFPSEPVKDTDPKEFQVQKGDNIYITTDCISRGENLKIHTLEHGKSYRGQKETYFIHKIQSVSSEDSGQYKWEVESRSPKPAAHFILTVVANGHRTKKESESNNTLQTPRTPKGWTPDSCTWTIEDLNECKIDYVKAIYYRLDTDDHWFPIAINYLPDIDVAMFKCLRFRHHKKGGVDDGPTEYILQECFTARGMKVGHLVKALLELNINKDVLTDVLRVDIMRYHYAHCETCKSGITPVLGDVDLIYDAAVMLRDESKHSDDKKNDSFVKESSEEDINQRSVPTVIDFDSSSTALKTDHIIEVVSSNKTLARNHVRGIEDPLLSNHG